jgi:hypothetical protein
MSKPLGSKSIDRELLLELTILLQLDSCSDGINRFYSINGNSDGTPMTMWSCWDDGSITIDKEHIAKVLENPKLDNEIKFKLEELLLQSI